MKVYFPTNYRVWSEDGNYMGMFDYFSQARKLVLEYGGIVVDANNEVVEKVPEDLTENDEYMTYIINTREWNWR